jgi:nicotinate phosphoribosyltransferase
VATAELITRADAGPAPDPGDAGPGAVRQRALLRPLVRDGEIVGQEPLDAARERHRAALGELPVHALQLSRGYPAIPTVFVPPGDE